MKNIFRVPGLLFLISLLTYSGAVSQDYLVTSRNDTIRGSIKPLLYGVEKKIQIETNNKEKKIYSMLETRMYTYKNENFYPVKGPEGYTFMKLLKRGYLSLYAFQLPNQTNYDGLMLTKLDGNSIEVPNLGFKRQLSKFLEDCEEVRTQISEGVYTKKDLHKIIDQYNLCIEKRSAGLLADTGKSAWGVLEEKVKIHPGFEGKSTVLEMIAEVKNKLKRSEKIPGFMLDGLKHALEDQPALHPALENALAEMP